MSNHYHLIGSTDEAFLLGEVMNWFQTSVARDINRTSGRINHVFGGSYKATLITNPYYFAHATRYVYQNPIRANICEKAEAYPFSTLPLEMQMQWIGEKIQLTSPCDDIYSAIAEMSLEERLHWYNERLGDDEADLLKKAVSKTVFKVPATRGSQKPHWLTSRLRV